MSFCVVSDRNGEFGEWKAEHDSKLLDKVAEKIDKALTDDDSIYKEISNEWDKGTFMGCVLSVIEEMKAEVR